METATTRRVTTPVAAVANHDVLSQAPAIRDLSRTLASRQLSHPSAAVASKSLAEYGKVPMRFERNQGQTTDNVKFLSRGQGYTVFLTPTETVMALSQPEEFAKTANVRHGRPAPQKKMATALRMTLVGANRAPQMEGIDELPGKSHYFVDSDPAKWRTNVPQYAKLRYRDVYKGVDVVYYGNQQQLEHDFVVAPGADPAKIRFKVAGADKLELNTGGELVLHVSGGQVRLHKPGIYQEIAGVKTEIAGGYQIMISGEVGFALSKYDTKQTLVIDPVIEYATYLGGSNFDLGVAIAVDSKGSAYVTGFTNSPDFPPTPGAFQADTGGTPFVTKLNPEGSDLVYSAYIGGSDNGGSGSGLGIAVDSEGNAFVTGSVASAGSHFPTTPGAFQTTFGGFGDAFVTKLNREGSDLVYSTFLSGSTARSTAFGIAIDSTGSAYVTGETEDATFPTTPGAFQTTLGGGPSPNRSNAFVTKFNPQGSALMYSTYLGGDTFDAGAGIAVDSAGNAYVTGSATSSNFPTKNAFQPGGPTMLCGPFEDEPCPDAFVTKLNPRGSDLVYSTFLGGSDFDEGKGIAVDAAGNAYVTGLTLSDNFPTTPGSFQPLKPSVDRLDTSAFVTKLNPEGSTLGYSTYLGGKAGSDGSFAIAVDSTGSAYVAGFQGSLDFPRTPDAFEPTQSGGFFSKLNPEGSDLVFSTSLTREPDGIALDSADDIYIVGTTTSRDLPTTPGAFQTTYAGVGINSRNAYIVKISLGNGVQAANQKAGAKP